MEHGPFKWVKPGSLKLPKRNIEEPDSINYDEPFEMYLADRDCISSSGIKNVIKSPRHYIAELAGYDVDGDEEKDHYRIGRAAHMMVLEPKKFQSLYVVQPDFGAMQSSKNREKRDTWRAEQDSDALILTQVELDHLMFMIDALLEHPEASNLLKNGKPEVTGRFTHKDSGFRCRIRPDYLTWINDELFVSDIKTTKDASPGLFSSDAAKLKYHLQLAFYHDGVEQITGHKPEAVALIAMEKKLPYTVAVYWINEDDLAKGRQWYRYGLDALKRCLETNDWPGIQRHGQMLNLPKWTDTESFPQFEWRE